MKKKKITLVIALLIMIISDNSATVSAQPMVSVNKNATNNPYNQNEPMVAINPLDHNKLVVGFNDFRSGVWKVGWSWSDDGGATWNYGGSFSFTGYTRTADPVVAFDSTGTCYLAGLAYNPYGNFGQDGSIFLAKSNDGGHTFTVFQKIVETGSGITPSLDKPWLYVNPFNNHIYLTWVKRQNAWSGAMTESSTIWFTRSTDGGTTFSSPVQISTFSPATDTDRSHGPQITAVSGNHIYVSWHTIESGTLPDPPTFPWRIWISESTDGGLTFGPNNLVITTAWGYPMRFISMDADPSSGRIYIAYADSTVMSPRDYDVFVTSSTSATGPWSTPVRVNDDSVGNGRWQFWPTLDVAPNGRVDVIWYDNRDDPTTGKNHVYYSASTDGGTTWEANTRITDVNSAWPNDWFPGDYSTIASVDEKAQAVWMDYRHGGWNLEVYTATVSRAPGVVLLFDTSGSMSWSHEGLSPVPEIMQRLNMSKEAAIPFLEIISDHYLGQIYFGIATFPSHPWDYSDGCIGQDVTPMTLADDTSINTAISTTIPNLVAEGNTPFLAGIDTAMAMFGPQPKRAIVLLSDGYHNCPSTVSPLDQQVIGRINQLNAESIRVYTIGFARPGDIDEPLLEAFAAQTGALFYDVTVPGFDPVNWDPLTALQATYKDILVNFLELEPLADPFGTIGAGEKVIHDVSLNEHDRKVSFFLSWASGELGRLGLTVRSSDGQPVPTTTNGIRFHQGRTHVIITVGEEFLRMPGKVGSTPWQVEINGGNLTAKQVKYQYSVISASSLNMKTSIEAPSLETGAEIAVSVRITEDGEPVTGLQNVTVDIIRPEEGTGNWFVENKVTYDELDNIPLKIGEEILSLRYRQSFYLISERNVAFPGQVEVGVQQLYDDGTHGDAEADDGIYTNTFVDTEKEGSYTFHFYAAGPTKGGNFFERDITVKEYLKPIFSPEHSEVNVISITGDEKIQRVRVNIVLKDALGNYLGPGYAGAITVDAQWGIAITDLEDELDGTYSQTIELPTSVSQGAEITVNFMEKSKSVVWEGPIPEKPTIEIGDLFNWLTWLLIAVIVVLIVSIIWFRARNQ